MLLRNPRLLCWSLFLLSVPHFLLFSSILSLWRCKGDSYVCNHSCSLFYREQKITCSQCTSPVMCAPRFTDYQGGWLCKYSATVVVGVAVATFIWRHAWMRRKEQHGSLDTHEVQNVEEASTSEDYELMCSCGLPAKLRISRTLRNPYRLFYNCPKNAHQHQCEYFCWSDETPTNIERSRKEIAYLRNECIRLHKKTAYVQSRRESDRAMWDRERSELSSKVTSVQSELNDIKRRIQYLYEIDNMPPCHESSSSITNEDEDGATVIEAL